MRFDGAAVLVTGATRGLGRALAEAFHREGAFVGIGYHRKEALARELAAGLGDRACACPLDVTDPDAIDREVGAFVERHGIDVLVNNAAIVSGAMFASSDAASWDAMIDVNLTGPARVTRRVARTMIGQRRGAIVNVASISATRPFPGQVAYAASKGGLVAFTRSLAVELAPHGVRVNAVLPGLFDAGMTRRTRTDVVERIRDAIPLGRLGEPPELARAVLFLASDDASYITGQALGVDGGLSI